MASAKPSNVRNVVSEDRIRQLRRAYQSAKLKGLVVPGR